MLAKLLRERKPELRADFQQFYHLDIDEIGRSITVFRAADLAAMLPRESRIVKAFNPDAEWNLETSLLSRIEFWTHILAWKDSKDAKAKRNVPELISPDKTSARQPAYSAPVDEYAELLARPRREVEGTCQQN